MKMENKKIEVADVEEKVVVDAEELANAISESEVDLNSDEEADALVEKLLSLENPYTCPHGRPTAIKMTKYDIERKFARK